MSGQIEMAKRWTESSRGQLLAALNSTPDDKLTWSPSSTCRSALNIAVHAAYSTRGISMAITGEEMPSMTMDEVMNASRAEEAKVTTREQAVAMINSSCDYCLKALDKVTPEQLTGMAKTPFGEFPMASWILIPSLHMDCHKSQIDYLQTIWGDMEMHM